MSSPVTTANACPQCGSTTMHVDFGRTFCANGHEQALGLVAEEDEADFLRTRGGRFYRDSRKNASGEGVEGTRADGGGRVLKGREAWELWTKAWGFVLWRGCWSLAALILDEWPQGGGDLNDEHRDGWRNEMWSVARGLWALRLEEMIEQWQESGEVGDDGTDLGESEEFESAEDVEDKTKHKVKSKHTLKEMGMPQLIDTAALNYLALLLMRHPISLSRLYSWLQTGAIPYLRAIRHVPKEMKNRLPPEYHRALDTTTVLQAEDLQLAIYRNAKLYRKQFAMVLPPLNWRPLLLEWIEALALPLQIYGMVKQLNSICEFDFAYPAAIHARRTILSFPEAQVMALLVVAVKLLYPWDADKVKRYPGSGNEPGLLRLDWTIWGEAKDWFETAVKEGREETLEPGKEMHIKDLDVMHMNDQHLDAYMDWYQRMWISQRDEGHGVQRELLAMFPMQAPAEDKPEERAQKRELRINSLRRERLARVLGELKARKVITEQDLQELEDQQPGITARILRPGMKYQVFQHVEDLDGTARQFHEEAAATACVSLKGLLRAIVKTESKIDRWRREKRREQAFSKEEDDEAMDLDATPLPNDESN